MLSAPRVRRTGNHNSSGFERPARIERGIPRKEVNDMRTELARKLTASTAAGALGVLLLAAPALAQGQPRSERSAPQAGETGRGGGEIRGGGEMRGSSQVRGGGEMRGSDQVRGSGTERRTQVNADTRSNPRANAQSNARSRGDMNVRSRGDVSVQTRRDARVRGSTDTNLRSDIRTDRRQAWSGDSRWRDERYRDRGPSVRVGIGTSDPYYAYGYDDGYRAYAAAEPYAYEGYARRGYADGYYSYGAAAGCTCAPAPYASTYGTGWGGHRWGFAAW